MNVQTVGLIHYRKKTNMKPSKRVIKAKEAKQVLVYRYTGFTVLNAYGSFWTQRVFGYEDEAEDYLKTQKLVHPTWDLSKHRVVEVDVTLTNPKKK